MDHRRVRFNSDPVDSYRPISPSSSETDSIESDPGPSTPPSPTYTNLYNLATPPTPTLGLNTPTQSSQRTPRASYQPQVYTPSPVSTNLSPSELFSNLPPSRPGHARGDSYSSGGYLHPQPPPVPVTINPALASPHLVFDLSAPPNRQSLHLPASALAAPATFPPVPSIVLQCPSLPWNITVEPSPTASPNSAKFISVQDVLDALYSNMRTPVKEAEFKALAPAMGKAVSDAFEKRWRAFVNGMEREKERGKGVKRVDFLVGKTRVDGLNKTSGTKDDSWVFNVR
ncbi:uncharacterized protein STEHIDRAFT_76247 [Stereum hirsutum FP-91666 SS1]|uniref:uncharacterized protein n=1 Tax=Stereum hirsutum (strain FP-91666) TaxID=721885 RepID=UPI000440D329|nr:uncharacterized protein STEHIDRAFT_76247 [Stereum hirsutum FP-91666 SS1]EIM89293.1 hypothetical protein STEHIDRAFT_76247 [Stereum hirsutum FP-91666 SS1]